MLSSTIIGEIIIFVLFLTIVSRLLWKRKPEELITFVLPLILLDFFIELMSIRTGKFFYIPNEGHLLFFGVSVPILILWLVALYAAFIISDKIFSRISVPIFVLSISDSTLVSLGNLIGNPLGVRIGWLAYSDWDYFVDGRFIGVPLWEFIGSFLMIFLFSFGYRTLKRAELKKRIVFIYGYIFLILTARFFVYLIGPQIQ